MWIIEVFKQMLGDENEEPPSKQEPRKMDKYGNDRCDIGIFYISSIFLCRNSIQSRRLVWEAVANHGHSNIL
jgi:hypothetical protein